MGRSTGKPWTREEVILAINLYCKIPFGTIHHRNPKIIALAELLGRTPGSVSYKLANLAGIDPALARKGASNCSKLDRAVWEAFFADWDAMAFESECLLAEKTSSQELQSAALERPDHYDAELPAGTTRDAVVKQRVNQNFFRKMVLVSYERRCCITGLAVPALLNASHIVPWSADVSSRTDPCNGLCLNALHDRAFDRGFITVDEEFRVVVSKHILDMPRADASELQRVSGAKLKMPHRFLPNQNYLAYHRSHVFAD